MYCQCISYAYAYVSEEFRNTESHNLKIAKIQDFLQKSGHVSEIHRYNYLGGNYLLRQQFTSLKGQPTAGGAISVQKVCFS